MLVNVSSTIYYMDVIFRNTPQVGPTRVCLAELGHGVAVGQLRGWMKAPCGADPYE